MQQEQQAVGMVEWLAVHPDVGGMNLGAKIIHDRAAHGHAAGLDPGARLAAGGVTEVGEELVEPAHDGWFATKSHKKTRKESGRRSGHIYGVFS